MQELWHFFVFNLTQAKWITVTSNFCMISKNSLLLSLKLVSKYLRLQQYICHLFSPYSLLDAGRPDFWGKCAFLFIVDGRVKRFLIIIFHNKLKEALRVSTQISVKSVWGKMLRHRKRIISVGGESLNLCQLRPGIVQLWVSASMKIVHPF